jgi:tetratricopeptide (TPR) repeat protein
VTETPSTPGKLQAVVLFDRGIEHFDNDKLDEAIAAFDEAIQNDPLFGLAYLIRGSAYSKKNILGPAIADFTEVIRLDPADFRAYRLRGNAYTAICEEAKAEADFAKAKQLEADDQKKKSSRTEGGPKKGQR